MRLCAIVLKAVHIQIFESRLNPPEINTHKLTHAVVLVGPVYLFGYFVKLCQLERSTALLKKLIVAQPVKNLPTSYAVRRFTAFQQDRALGSAEPYLRTNSVTRD